jgi:glutamate/tyrosine decarboxylase-like PLP-dependent enzyme
MNLARNERFPKANTKGLFDLPRFSLFASDQVHFSFVKGLMFNGFGKDALVKVKSDQKGRIMLSHLQDAIDTEMQKGRRPLMVIGIAGTTVAGVYDDLEAIADIARQYNLWFHVDGAYGASLLFSKTEKAKLNGIERADSVSWSLHKMMGVPLSCAVLLTRANDILARNFSVDANYLFHGNEYDLGQKSLQCGRRADALKLWLAWKFEGDQGFEQRVNQLMKLAMRFARMIKASHHLELLTLPESPIICFRYIDHRLNNDELNVLNRAIRAYIFNQGEILFNYVLHREKIYLRCVLSDPSMTDRELRLIIEVVNKVGYKQSSGLRNSVLDLPHPIGGS